MTQPQGGNLSSLLTRRPSDVFPPQRSLFSRPGTAPVLPPSSRDTLLSEPAPDAHAGLCPAFLHGQTARLGTVGFSQPLAASQVCRAVVTRFRESVSIMPGHLPLGVNSYSKILAHPGHV